MGGPCRSGTAGVKSDVQKAAFGSIGATIPLTVRVIGGAWPISGSSGPGIFSPEPTFRPNVRAVCCVTRTGSTG